MLLETYARLNTEDVEPSQKHDLTGHKEQERGCNESSTRQGRQARQKDTKHTHNPPPLSLAAEEGKEEIVELLLNRDANADGKDQFHRTPLWFAARNGQVAMVKLLLARAISI